MTWDDEGRRIDDEVAHHLAELEARLRAEGLGEDEARREARQRFGDPGRIARATRAAVGPAGRGLRTGIAGDLHQALRGLRRAPAFTGAVVVTLALALGASATVFGVVHDVLLRPLGFDEPDGLVALVERHDETGTTASPTSRGTFQDWRRGLPALEALAGWEWISATLEDPDRPEELLTVLVNPEFFRVLGVQPVLGRGFVAADAPAPSGSDQDAGDAADGSPGVATVVVLSHELWRRRFGADAAVLGRTLPIEGVGREVVGVLPPGLPLPGPQAQLLLPTALEPADPTNRGGRVVGVVGRLAAGASAAEADAQVRALTERIALDHPTSARGWSAAALPLREHLLGDVRRPVLVAFAAVTLLLLVAAVNVANLLLVRAADGRRDLAVRAALGAGRGRLVRIRLAESLLLALGGGAGGVILTLGLQRVLAALEPGILPTRLDPVPAPAVWGFALVLTLGLGALVGVAPAVRAARAALSDVARGTGGTGRGTFAGGWARRLLVVAQLAVTVVLLVGAGLLIRTVAALRAVDPGFEPAGLVAARVTVDRRRYDSPPAIRSYYEQVLARVRALPGVEAAGLTSALPMDPVATNFDLPTRPDTREGVAYGELPQADFRIVGDGLAEALRLRLLHGRLLAASDGAGDPLVGVVNRSFVETFWPGLDPREAVGRRFQMPWTERFGWHEVVGVVEDTRFYGPTAAARPEMQISAHQVTWDFVTIAARTTGDPAALERALERVLVEVDPLMPAQDVLRVSTLVAATTAAERFHAFLLAGFASLALALAAAGVYGVLAYAVRLRSRELGVRLALGARRSQVLAMVVWSGVVLAGAGVALGLAAAVPATRLVSGMLFGVRPLDPMTLAGVAALLLVVSVAACLRPAWRASRLDPVRILRED